MLSNNTMGASCSTSVRKKYAEIKMYLKTKPCLVFDVVETLVSKTGSPMVLMGEDHTENEVTKYDLRTCATVMAMVKDAVSECEEPKTNIVVFLETSISRFRQGDWQKKVLEPETDGRINTEDVIHQAFNSIGEGRRGVEVKPFDFLREFREMVIPPDMQDDPEEETVQSIEDAKWDRFQKYMVRKRFREIHESVGLEYDSDKFYDAQTCNLDPETSMDLRGTHPEGKWDTENTCPRYLLNLMLKTYCCTKIVANEAGLSDLEKKIIEGDLLDSSDKATVFPAYMNVFMFGLLMGDALAYFLSIRPYYKVNDSIVFVYGGSLHTGHFSKWLNACPYYKSDFTRISQTACEKEYIVDYISQKVCRPEELLETSKKPISTKRAQHLQVKIEQKRLYDEYEEFVDELCENS